MPTQKRLSQISFAAAALLVAALPGLAQTESHQNRKAIERVQPTEIATLRNERLGVRNAEPVAANKSVAQTTKAARENFNEAIARATSSTSNLSSPATISESDWQKTQRVADQADANSAKRISFVASRGQKLPE
ncbi:MAG TPA: hypothetical protein VE961_24635 [Pyrinomonadaceae bacterium]|nr:hypothetical protein [Pyrinomonadaceae bacterium]